MTMQPGLAVLFALLLHAGGPVPAQSVPVPPRVDGKTAKEIGEMLNVSVRTIEFHKKGIRSKLGLKNKKVNLRSHLLSMTN